MRHVVLAFVLVAMVCGAWFWWRGDDASVPQSPSPANERVETDAAAKEAAASAAAPVVAPAAPPEAAAVDRTAVADAKWVEARIVDAVTKQPVAGADVRWTGPEAWGKFLALTTREQVPLIGHSHRLAVRFGERTRSDALGIARVTMHPNGVTIHATEGSRYGTCHLQEKTPPVERVLELREDRTLRVQVLDVHGQPAIGTEVRIRFGAAGKPDSNRGQIQPEHARAPDGIAEFEHVQDWLRGGFDEAGATTEWRVALHVPGVDDPGVQFDRDALPAEPIVLRLPATGVLAARLLHEERPWTEDTMFETYVAAKVGDRHGKQGPRIVPDADGWARLRVALGATFTVTCSTHHLYLEHTVPGPVAERQEVHAEFRTDEAICFAGRIVAADGLPLASTAVSCDYGLAHGASGQNARVSTDASGRFLWFTAAAPKEPTKLEKIEWRYTPGEGASARATTGPRDVVAGINDLGDVRLRVEPFVVSGRVQWDPPDQPSHAWITVQRLGPAPSRDGAEHWDRVERLVADQGPGGTFVFRGDVEPGRYRLAVSDANNLPVEPIEFRIGQQDVVIPVTLGSRLFANCLLPEGLTRQHVRGVLRPAGKVPAEERNTVDGLPSRYISDTWRDRDVPNPMSWRCLPSGTYALELCAVGHHEPLAVINDVVVPPPPGGDPRLVDIDLRGVRRAVTVRTTMSAPPEGGRGVAIAFLEPREGGEQWEGVTGDPLVVPAPLRAFEMVVARERYQPVRMTVGATQTAIDVVLEPWPTASLTIAGAPPLPDGFAWFASLQDPRPASKAQYRFAGGGGGSLDNLMRPPRGSQPFVNGIATVPVADGTLRIHAYLQRDKGRRIRSVRNITPAEVVAPAVAPITLRVSADEVAAAIAELQKPAAGK